jgi:hypothetical protein
MPPKKKQRLPDLPGQKILFSFVGRDGNTNFDPDDSVRKETENMIDSGSQDVQVESDSEPDNDDTPTLSLAHQIVMLNITRKTSANTVLLEKKE